MVDARIVDDVEIELDRMVETVKILDTSAVLVIKEEPVNVEYVMICAVTVEIVAVETVNNVVEILFANCDETVNNVVEIVLLNCVEMVAVELTVR